MTSPQPTSLRRNLQVEVCREETLDDGLHRVLAVAFAVNRADPPSDSVEATTCRFFADGLIALNTLSEQVLPTFPRATTSLDGPPRLLRVCLSLLSSPLPLKSALARLERLADHPKVVQLFSESLTVDRKRSVVREDDRDARGKRA